MQIRYNSFWIVFLFVFLSACQIKKQTDGLPYYNTPDFTPIWSTVKTPDSIHTIAAFQFTDQNNTSITHATFKNKIYVANFFFTACSSVCPKMMNNLLEVQKAFANDTDVLLLSHSVTPWKDSVAVLKSFANEYKINDLQWHLVTGKKSEIYELARKSYFAEEEPGFTRDSSEFLHTEHVLLIDKKSRIRGIYNGTLALEMQRLIADIKLLKKEVCSK